MLKYLLAALLAVSAATVSCADAQVASGETDADSDGDGDGDSDGDGDADNCAEDPCDENATCTSIEDGYTCDCNQGWSGNGETCSDVDECLQELDDCDDLFGVCTNTEGSFECDCEPGYTGTGTDCDDENECTSGTAQCDTNAICTNLDGGFYCECGPGYEGDGGVCTELPPEIEVDLTPPNGSVTYDDPYWSTKGYIFTTTAAVELTGGSWLINQPAGSTITARLYSSGGTLLASGTPATGAGNEQWYRSDISYSLAAGTTYTLAFYNTAATTSTFVYKNDPSQPFNVGTYFTSVRSKSNGSDAYPTSNNSWAPYMKIIFVP